MSSPLPPAEQGKPLSPGYRCYSLATLIEALQDLQSIAWDRGVTTVTLTNANPFYGCSVKLVQTGSTTRSLGVHIDFLHA